MNQKEFWAQLAKLKKNDWRFDADGMLRCKKGDCPITAVARAKTGQVFKPNDYLQASDELGLNCAFAGDIVEAADNTEWEIKRIAQERSANSASSFASIGPDDVATIKRRQSLRRKIAKTLGLAG